MLTVTNFKTSICWLTLLHWVVGLHMFQKMFNLILVSCRMGYVSPFHPVFKSYVDQLIFFLSSLPSFFLACFLSILFCVFFQNMVLLHNPIWPTHCVDNAGPKLTETNPRCLCPECWDQRMHTPAGPVVLRFSVLSLKD